MDPGHLSTQPALSCPVSTECECTVFQIKIPICICHTSTHQFWQQHTCGALGESPMEGGVVGQPYESPYFHLRKIFPFHHPKNCFSSGSYKTCHVFWDFNRVGSTYRAREIPVQSHMCFRVFSLKTPKADGCQSVNRLCSGVKNFHSCLHQWGMASYAACWVWRRTNREPYCAPMSNPSTSSWSARPVGSG